jgi:hypothetical protein
VIVVKIFIDSRSGVNDSIIYFVISVDYMKLKINVTFFYYSEGHFSTNTTYFFKLCFMHKCLSLCDLYITHPHLWDIVKNRRKEKGESMHIII